MVRHPFVSTSTSTSLAVVARGMINLHARAQAAL